MTISEKIQGDLKVAMRAKDQLKLSTLRMLSAAVKNFEIEKGGAGYSAMEEDVVSVIQKQVKQRKDSIEQYRSGGRDELAEKEEKELKILESYLPEQLSEEEVAGLVQNAISKTGATSQADIGKVMGTISGELKGKADMGVVSKIVREKLK